jgi:hypothetical protein
MNKQDMRFGVIRMKQELRTMDLAPDGGKCPYCNHDTEAAYGRRYCTNSRCNALILESI